MGKNPPEKDREYGRRYRQAHPERVRERKRRERENWQRLGINPQLPSMRKFRHGPDHEVMWATFWDAQQGLCYLCGDPLSTESYRDIHVDHDHTCCPKGRTCAFCRRGLACDRCNMLIGAAGDDPDLLR